MLYSGTLDGLNNDLFRFLVSRKFGFIYDLGNIDLGIRPGLFQYCFLKLFFSF